ncbi:histidine kinase N-terminal 7TM domain-containing protein [Natrarchaeobius chitinivorans]|uniref:histidine kinase n=1 Tax=Natrarchaeobius chitinivorans TaxID=1679083 RepID=A0A3N6LMR0_NATCH|nr:histidine kinase N-terminal 7TM domain-containing protein [Natrarchaeobius chitinivorans]RQG90493.1 hypothetical protein EA473_20910 [Natrarchaeobius chitinivorans]
MVSIPVLVVLTSGIIALLLALEAIRNRPNPMAWPLSLLMVSVAAWALPYGVSIASTAPESVLLWNRLRYPGTVAVPVAYLVVAMTYAGKAEWLSRRACAALAVVPAAVLASVGTNRYHGYYFRSTSVTRVEGASIVAIEPGPLFWTNVAYSYALICASLVVLVLVFFRSGTIYRKQSGLLMIAGVVPLATNVAVNVLTEPGSSIDFTTTALTISGGAFAIALFHFDLFDLRPVARDKLVEELDDGVIVVDREGTVADVNDLAKRLLDGLEIGDTIGDVLPADLESDDEFTVRLDGRIRVYRYRSTPLTDQFGRRSGRIVYLDDVTDLAQREQRLSVLNRVLQHNLRNELSLVIGHLETAMETATDPTDEHIDAARESATEVVALARKARTLEQTVDDHAASDPVCVSTVVDRTLEDLEGVHPEVTFEREWPEASKPTAAASEPLFEAAVENLLENAVVHNDADQPRVAVRIETRDDRVRLSIADNGPGIPDAEYRILHNRAETPLDHGSGLGLWIAKWTATLSDGELSVAENEPRGTVISLSLPLAE